MDATGKPYPVSLTVEYPEGPRNRASAFFRLFLIVPIAVILILLVGTGYDWGFDEAGRGLAWASAGFAIAPTLLMILFRRKYPRWWFDWNLNLNRFLFRVSAYLALLRDEYPSTDEEQAIHLEVSYPDATTELNRWLPLVKWLLVIPHIIVLAFVDIAAYACVYIAWFAILFTGRYPRALFDFVVGVMRWQARVVWYAALFSTDRYPPFSFDA
jgi:hypothetical protein